VVGGCGVWGGGKNDHLFGAKGRVKSVFHHGRIIPEKHHGRDVFVGRVGLL